MQRTRIPAAAEPAPGPGQAPAPLEGPEAPVATPGTPASERPVAPASLAAYGASAPLAGTGTSAKAPARKRRHRASSGRERDKHHLYRASVVRYVDALAYEPGRARWCHSRIYALITRELCGIGKKTFRQYLKYPAEALAGHDIAPELKALLRLYVTMLKSLPVCRIEPMLHAFRQAVEETAEQVKKDARRPDLEAILAMLRSIH